MRVSVVICTLNRAVALRNTLNALRQQNYPDFEVVVVNGPSTDGTDVVVDEFSDLVRVERCPLPNLSVSRNIGIRASGGEIVAFIDDDAIPEFDWLNQAIPSFDDPEVGGVGGIVFDHTGVTLQYRFSAANRFGEAFWDSSLPYDQMCVPGGTSYPYLQGTNALFRRRVLEIVGGFDETYDYYLDETDVCCRIVDAGFVLRQLDRAPVHHKFLPSGVRDHRRVVTNEYPIVKNHTYFGFRHALAEHGEAEVVERAGRFLEHRVAEALKHEGAGHLPPGAADRARSTGEDAMAAGAALGRERHNLRLGPVSWPQPKFRQFPGTNNPDRRRYVLISAGYGDNMTGGVARYTTDLAAGLAAAGAEVRVLTSTTGHNTVDLEDGVWVHRLNPKLVAEDGVEPSTFESINRFTTAVVNEVERIGAWAPIDLVYGAIWDVEPLGVLRRTALPVMVHLVTPAAVAAREAGWMDEAQARPAIERLMELEHEVLRSADLLHANGRPVILSTREHYPGALDPGRIHVAHLGLSDRAPNDVDMSLEAAAPKSPGSQLSVLFVGRLEARKGIDLFLGTVTALADRLPNVRWTIAGADSPLAPGEPLVGTSFLDTHALAGWIDRVRVLGVVDDGTLHELYRHADVVVLPSRYESFGLVMLETMMHGKALVSCDVGGIVEVVRNGVDGVLVAPGNQPALDAAVEQMILDGERRLEFGRAARQRFTEYFAMPHATVRFIAAANRVQFHAADSPLFSIGGVFNWTQGAGGRRSALIEELTKCEIEIPKSDQWRLAVSGTGNRSAELLIANSYTTRVTVEPGRFTRIDLDGPTTLTVDGPGCVEVAGLIELRGGDAS